MDTKRCEIDVPEVGTTIEAINERIESEEGIQGLAISTHDLQAIETILRDNLIDEGKIIKLLKTAKLNNGEQTDAIGISVAYGIGNLVDEIRGIVRPNTPGVHIPLPGDTGPKLVSEQYAESPKIRSTFGEAGAIAENNRVFGEAVINVLSNTRGNVLAVLDLGKAVTVNEDTGEIETRPLEGKNTSVYQNLISLPFTENRNAGSPHGIFVALEGDNIDTALISKLLSDETSLGFGGMMCVNGKLTATVNKGGPDHDVNMDRMQEELGSRVVLVEKTYTQEIGTITQDTDLVTSQKGHAHFPNSGHFMKAEGKVFLVAWPFAKKITSTFGKLSNTDS